MISFADEPWRLSLISADKIELHLNLYEESIEVPSLEMFGPLNGYLGGDIYGVWPITSFKIKDDKNATLRVSNDLGSESQEISLTQTSDSTWTMQFEGHNAIRKVNGKKLVKIPSVYTMKRK